MNYEDDYDPRNNKPISNTNSLGNVAPPISYLCRIPDTNNNDNNMNVLQSDASNIPSLPSTTFVFTNNNDNLSNHPTTQEMLVGASIYSIIKNDIKDLSKEEIKQKILELDLNNILTPELKQQILETTNNIESYAKKKM